MPENFYAEGHVCFINDLAYPDYNNFYNQDYRYPYYHNRWVGENLNPGKKSRKSIFLVKRNRIIKNRTYSIKACAWCETF